MNFKDKDYNKDRSRRYGLRIGDRVRLNHLAPMPDNSHLNTYGIVTDFLSSDNNRVFIKVDGFDRIIDYVCEWCTIIEKVKEPVTEFQALQQKYYEFAEIANDHFERLNPDIENYVNALEERELKMLNIFKEIITIYDCKYLLQPIIEEITGQSIEEVLKR